MADTVNYDQCDGGLVKRTDFSSVCGGICAQPDTVVHSPPKDFFRCGAFGTSFFYMSFGEHPFEELFFSHSDLKIQSYFMKLAFDKACEVDLECYENAEYFEKHIRALFGFLALSGLALSLDGFMILFIGLQMIANLVFARKENYERRAYEVELDESNRQTDYIRRVHYMPEYAKELRTKKLRL